MDHELMITIITIVGSVLASSGFWAYLQSRRDRKNDKDDANKALTDLLKGLAHDRIVFIGNKYLERGWLTKDEYDDLLNIYMNPTNVLGAMGWRERS